MSEVEWSAGRPLATLPFMRKLRRWAFNTLTILSLLLCIATATVWMQSYRNYCVLQWESGERPHHDRPIWGHHAMLGANRGMLLAQNGYWSYSGDTDLSRSATGLTYSFDGLTW